MAKRVPLELDFRGDRIYRITDDGDKGAELGEHFDGDTEEEIRVANEAARPFAEVGPGRDDQRFTFETSAIARKALRAGKASGNRVPRGQAMGRGPRTEPRSAGFFQAVVAV